MEMNVVAYIRVSTSEQGRSGLSLEAQRGAVQAECERKGWVLTEIFEDVASGKSTNGRHGLKQAVEMCVRKQADVLMATRLDRISRSTLDFATMAEQARRQGWAINVLDISMDMTTPHGEAMATMAMAFATLERRLIGERTKTALAQAKRNGVVLGRPVVMKAATRRRIQRLRDKGWSYEVVASYLNDHGVTTDGGSQWWMSSIRRACLS